MDETQSIPACDWSAWKAALHQSTLPPRGTIKERLLRSMDPEVARSFTDTQICELERVLATGSSRPPPINIRLTVPFFYRRYFLTVLAGGERRDAARLKKDRVQNAFWTLTNATFMAFLLLLFVPAFIGLVHIFTYAY
jgi:hypothetical protein